MEDEMMEINSVEVQLQMMYQLVFDKHQLDVQYYLYLVELVELIELIELVIIDCFVKKIRLR